MISSDDHNYNHDDHTDDDDDHAALMMMMMDLAMEHPELLRASAAAPMFESNFSPQRDTYKHHDDFDFYFDVQIPG